MTDERDTAVIIRPIYSFSLGGNCASTSVSNSSDSDSDRDAPIVLNFNLGCGGGTYGLKRTGQIIWDGSVVLARFIESNPCTMRGKNVLEIGSGTCPLPTLTAGYVGAKRVIATDTHEEMQELQMNIYRNSNLIPTKLDAVPLDWKNYDVMNFSPANLDVLICADVIYELSLELLVALFNDLFSINPQVEVYMTNTDRKHVRLFHRQLKNFLEFEEIHFYKQEYPHVVTWKITRRTETDTDTSSKKK